MSLVSKAYWEVVPELTPFYEISSMVGLPESISWEIALLQLDIRKTCPLGTWYTDKLLELLPRAQAVVLACKSRYTLLEDTGFLNAKPSLTTTLCSPTTPVDGE